VASSIYVYPDFQTYNKYYGKEREDITHECVLIDLYIDPKKEKIYVITNTNTEKERVNQRTITQIRNESFKNEYINDECLLVTDKKIRYKKGYLEFFPRFLRKPLLKIRVDRCIGGDIKKSYINLNSMKYDFIRDRINLTVVPSQA